VETIEYARGRLVDLFGEPAQPTVLLWHGSQANARASVRALAESLADHGLGVIAPDWNSHADDGGRSDLLRSVHFARTRVQDTDGLILAGWSLGGTAAAGLTLHARDHGMRFAHTICLAGAFMVRDPICGERPTELPAGAKPSPFTLLHGSADDIIPISVSRGFASTLQHNGWPVEVVQIAADHGSIAGAVYDPVADRYSAADDPTTLAIAADVAARIAAVVRATPKR
jgi:dienelactone hydrolase